MIKFNYIYITQNFSLRKFNWIKLIFSQVSNFRLTVQKPLVTHYNSTQDIRRDALDIE